MSLVWGQTRIPQTVHQKKALFNSQLSFAPFNSHSSSYFHDYNILKFCDIINIESCAFINNCFISNTFSVFTEDLNLYQNLMLTTLDYPVKDHFLFQAILLKIWKKFNNLFCYSNMVVMINK